MNITISIEKMWKYIGHLPTILMIYEISYKVFIYIFKFHDIEFFIEGFYTVSMFHMQMIRKTLFWNTISRRKLLLYVEPQIWLQ